MRKAPPDRSMHRWELLRLAVLRCRAGESKPSCRGERLKVAIASDEANLAINATLRNESVTESRFPAFAQYLCPQCTRSFPEAGGRFDERDIAEHFDQAYRKLWITQQLHEHSGNHHQLSIRERFVK